MNTNTTAPAGVVSSTEFDACRAAFVHLMKKEDELRAHWSKTSLRAHWSGRREGFAEPRVQARWQDFRAGWLASNASFSGGPSGTSAASDSCTSGGEK